MTLASEPYTLDRCGIASLLDLEQPSWKDTVAILEKYQSKFSEHETEIVRSDYLKKWPREPLYWWSRIWEYPYVYRQLVHLSERQEFTKGSVLDLGSGTTFFPFAVADLGFDLTCVDADEECVRGLEKAKKALKVNRGTIRAFLADGNNLPFPESSFDVLYSVSVLEHVSTVDTVCREMARVLKPKGVAIITMDLDGKGTLGLGVGEYLRLIETIRQEFDWAYPTLTVHPLDVLWSNRGPYPYRPASLFKQYTWWVKAVLKSRRVPDWKPLSRRDILLSVEGLTLVKR